MSKVSDLTKKIDELLTWKEWNTSFAVMSDNLIKRREELLKNGYYGFQVGDSRDIRQVELKEAIDLIMQHLGIELHWSHPMPGDTNIRIEKKVGKGGK